MPKLTRGNLVSWPVREPLKPRSGSIVARTLNDADKNSKNHCQRTETLSTSSAPSLAGPDLTGDDIGFL
jgi:hypothetical protein